MTDTIQKNSHKARTSVFSTILPSDHSEERTEDGGYGSAIRQTRQRYCTMALTMAIFIGAALMLLGYAALGKGLILGTLFSIFNFILMSLALPMRLGIGRGKSFLFSLVSIYLRYAILALPLVWALKQETFAVSAVAAGLFMVQLAILGDHLLARWRHSMEAG